MNELFELRRELISLKENRREEPKIILPDTSNDEYYKEKIRELEDVILCIFRKYMKSEVVKKNSKVNSIFFTIHILSKLMN